MNNSTTAKPALDFSSQQTYIGCGLCAVVSNIVVIFVLTSNKFLLKKSAFAIGLSVGDIINGLALLITGFKRIEYAKQGISGTSVRNIECLKGFSTLWLIGTQLPVVIMLVVGIERVLAIAFFTWYYKVWSNKIAWMLTGAVYLYVSFSIGAVWGILINLPVNVTTSLSCTTPSVIGYSYSLYHYGLAIFCGCVAITTTVVSLIILVRKKRRLQKAQQNNHNANQFIKKQWPITVSMACIAVFDFFMVVIPNLLLLMTNFVQFPPELKNVGGLSADFICMRSASSLFIYIVFNRDFRLVFIKWVGIKGQNAILPTNLQMSTMNVQKNQVSLF